jgi:hypothetical protein
MQLNLLKSVSLTAYLLIDLKNTAIKLLDGTTPTALELEIKIGEGNVTWDETRNVEYILDRGRIDEVRLGDEVPMDINFDFIWEFLSGDTSSAGALPTVEDVLKNRGNASTWISSDPDTCRPFAIDIVLENIPPCGTGGSPAEQEIITLPDFRYTSLSHDLRAATVAVTGQSNATEATSVRSFQPST